MKKILASALVAAIAAVTVSCSSAVEFTYTDGNLVNSENGLTYVCAPMYIEPIEIESDVFGVCSEHNIELHAIAGLDTELWLSEKYEGIGTVYYADGKVEIPDLEAFSADGLFICREDTKTVGIANVDSAEDVSAVIDAFLNGDETSPVTSGERYKLKFTSEEYPGIYYSLEYYESDSGANCIYDRSAGNWREVGDVLYKYLPRASS